MQLYSLKEVSENQLKVSRSTIYRLIKSGDLHRVRVRGCVKITSASVDKYIKNLCREAF